MNARPRVRDAIVAKKMLKWSLVGQGLRVDATCPPARARKNFWRLIARYPEIARRLHLDEASVY